MLPRLNRHALRIAALIVALIGGLAMTTPSRADTYTAQEIVDSGHRFFGATSGGLATVIEKIFSSYGLPNGYVLGEEGSGALIGGLTYGEGTLYTKNAGDHKVFWQGPSLGWDFGGNGDRMMMLVYNLDDVQNLYDRFAGVAGSAYVVAGLGFNVMKKRRRAAGSGAHRRRRAAWRQYRLPQADRSADLEPVLTAALLDRGAPARRAALTMRCAALRRGTGFVPASRGRYDLPRFRCWRLSIGLKRDPVHPVLHTRFFVRWFPGAHGGAGDLAARRGVDAQAHRGVGAAVAHRHPGRQGPHARRVRHVDETARNEHQGVQGQGGSSDHRDQPQPRRTETPCRRAATARTNRFPSWKPSRASCAASSASAKTSCSALAAKLAEAERAIEARALELDKMGRLYDEASLAASNRQIDLVVRENEVEKLAGDMQLLRSQRKDAERRLQDITAENKAARDALKGERKKVTELEKKLERMIATLTDREEKLDRRERELARLREQLKGNAGAEDELDQKLIDAQADKIKLEAELADMTLQMSTLHFRRQRRRHREGDSQAFRRSRPP